VYLESFNYITYRIDKIRPTLLLAFETLSKTVSIIQDRANAVSANTFRVEKNA